MYFAFFDGCQPRWLGPYQTIEEARAAVPLRSDGEWAFGWSVTSDPPIDDERIARKVRRDFPQATSEERAWHETWERDHRGVPSGR